MPCAASLPALHTRRGTQCAWRLARTILPLPTFWRLCSTIVAHLPIDSRQQRSLQPLCHSPFGLYLRGRGGWAGHRRRACRCALLATTLLRRHWRARWRVRCCSNGFSCRRRRRRRSSSSCRRRRRRRLVGRGRRRQGCDGRRGCGAAAVAAHGRPHCRVFRWPCRFQCLVIWRGPGPESTALQHRCTGGQGAGEGAVMGGPAGRRRAG